MDWRDNAAANRAEEGKDADEDDKKNSLALQVKKEPMYGEHGEELTPEEVKRMDNVMRGNATK